MNTKIQELRFDYILHKSQMFNVLAHGYMAYIETVFRFVPNALKIGRFYKVTQTMKQPVCMLFVFFGTCLRSTALNDYKVH